MKVIGDLTHAQIDYSTRRYNLHPADTVVAYFACVRTEVSTTDYCTGSIGNSIVMLAEFNRVKWFCTHIHASYARIFLVKNETRLLFIFFLFSVSPRGDNAKCATLTFSSVFSQTSSGCFHCCKKILLDDSI